MTNPARIWLILVFFTACPMSPGILPGQQPAATPEAASQTDLGDGLYLVLRWTTDREDLLPLLDGEILIEHDPAAIEPDSDSPRLYVTVGTGERILFQPSWHFDPVNPENGRTSLQVTMSDDASAKLESMSRQYLGRQVATVIDGQAITLHKVRTIIRNGQLQITRCTDDGCQVLLERLQNQEDR